jgi:hypothetical protein
VEKLSLISIENLNLGVRMVCWLKSSLMRCFLFRPKASGRAILTEVSYLKPVSIRYPLDGAFSGDLRSRIEIRGSACEPVKQSL